MTRILLHHARTALYLSLLSLAPVGARSLHPPFPLLDADGVSVLSSGKPHSFTRSCSGCHDTEFITRHSSHSRLAPPEGVDALAWLQESGGRHVGGGSMAGIGLEHDCFLCHLDQVAMPERVRSIEEGRVSQSGMALLSGTELVEATAGGYRWNARAFAADGSWPVNRLPLRDPGNQQCGLCHGVVQDGQQPLHWPDGLHHESPGSFVWSGQRISASGLNLEHKNELTRSWDLHAERLLDCTSCHHAPNHPAYRLESSETRPQHLLLDGRRMDISEYLARPLHDLSLERSMGNGESRPTLTCTTCHDPAAGHDWLPYAERHHSVLSCEACHIPSLHAADVMQTDRSALDETGKPLLAWHGSPGVTPSSTTYQQTWKPLLVENGRGDGRITPMTISTSWFWTEDGRELPLEVVRKAWSRIETLLPAAFDTNGDGLLQADERKLVTQQRVEGLQQQLRALGIRNPVIQGRLELQPVSHNVAGGRFALRDCESCHSPASRFEDGLPAWEWRPWQAGLTPSANGVTLSAAGLALPLRSGQHYVLGLDSVSLVDLLGLLSVIAALGGGLLHGVLRYRARKGKQA